MEASDHKGEFLCGLCLEQFREPKALPCLHSFCLRCLDSYVQSDVDAERRGGILCPLCGAYAPCPGPGKPPFKWAALWPSNFFLRRADQQPEDSRIVMQSEECYSCRLEGRVTQAASWCRDCAEAFCESCQWFHSRMPSLMAHNLQAMHATTLEERRRDRRHVKPGEGESSCRSHAARRESLVAVIHLTDTPSCGSTPSGNSSREYGPASPPHPCRVQQAHTDGEPSPSKGRQPERGRAGPHTKDPPLTQNGKSSSPRRRSPQSLVGNMEHVHFSAGVAAASPEQGAARLGEGGPKLPQTLQAHAAEISENHASSHPLSTAAPVQRYYFPPSPVLENRVRMTTAAVAPQTRLPAHMYNTGPGVVFVPGTHDQTLRLGSLPHRAGEANQVFYTANTEQMPISAADSETKTDVRTPVAVYGHSATLSSQTKKNYPAIYSPGVMRRMGALLPGQAPNRGLASPQKSLLPRAPRTAEERLQGATFATSMRTSHEGAARFFLARTKSRSRTASPRPGGSSGVRIKHRQRSKSAPRGKTRWLASPDEQQASRHFYPKSARPKLQSSKPSMISQYTQQLGTKQALPPSYPIDQTQLFMQPQYLGREFTLLARNCIERLHAQRPNNVPAQAASSQSWKEHGQLGPPFRSKYNEVAAPSAAANAVRPLHAATPPMDGRRRTASPPLWKTGLLQPATFPPVRATFTALNVVLPHAAGSPAPRPRSPSPVHDTAAVPRAPPFPASKPEPCRQSKTGEQLDETRQRRKGTQNGTEQKSAAQEPQRVLRTSSAAVPGNVSPMEWHAVRILAANNTQIHSVTTDNKTIPQGSTKSQNARTTLNVTSDSSAEATQSGTDAFESEVILTWVPVEQSLPTPVTRLEVASPSPQTEVMYYKALPYNAELAPVRNFTGRVNTYQGGICPHQEGRGQDRAAAQNREEVQTQPISSKARELESSSSPKATKATNTEKEPSSVVLPEAPRVTPFTVACVAGNLQKFGMHPDTEKSKGTSTMCDTNRKQNSTPTDAEKSKRSSASHTTDKTMKSAATALERAIQVDPGFSLAAWGAQSAASSAQKEQAPHKQHERCNATGRRRTRLSDHAEEPPTLHDTDISQSEQSPNVASRPSRNSAASVDSQEEGASVYQEATLPGDTVMGSSLTMGTASSGGWLVSSEAPCAPRVAARPRRPFNPKLVAKVSTRLKGNLEAPWVRDVVVMPCKVLLASDFSNHCLKAWEWGVQRPKISVFKLDSAPFGLADLDEAMVAVTLPHSWQVVVVEVTPPVTLTRRALFTTERGYFGVAALGPDRLAAICPDFRLVDIIDLRGQVLSTLQMDKLGRHLMECSYYVCPAGHGDLVLSDFSAGCAQRVSGQGESRWSWGKGRLREPHGVCRDDEGFIYVADCSGGRATGTVWRLTPEGGAPLRVLTHDDDGLEEPWGLAWFRGHLVVGDSGAIRVYHMDTPS